MKKRANTLKKPLSPPYPIKNAAPLCGVIYTEEQICQIIAAACENPEDSDHPVSHWTPETLRREVVKRGIVDEISTRTVGRIIKEADLKPHQIRYWEHPPRENKEQFKQEVKAVCTTYAQAQELESQRTHTVCVDEKTGIQALGEPYPTLPMKSGQPERQEFTYQSESLVKFVAEQCQIDVELGVNGKSVDFSINMPVVLG